MEKFLYSLETKRAIDIWPLAKAHREGAKNEIETMKILLSNANYQEKFFSPPKKFAAKILSFGR